MAGNGTGKLFQGLALAVTVVAVGAAIGYYAGGPRTGQPAATAGVQEAGTPPDVAPPARPSLAPHSRPARASSDYSAPGAPRIHIVEAKSPSLGTASRPRVASRSSDTTNATDIPTPDAEASQESPSAPPPSDSAPGATPTPPGPPSDTEAAQAGPTADGGALPPPAPAATDTPPAKHMPPAPADSEASQVGDAGAAAKGAGAAQYRIQAGAFADAKAAHDYLNSLQGRGYDATLHTERQGGQAVYHVQVGAYHDRAAAEDAAAGFRHDGIPVTVTPVGP